VIGEVTAVGTELLLGQIVNSNVAFVGRKLAEERFDAHFHVTVGDTPLAWSRRSVLPRLNPTPSLLPEASDQPRMT
jgi:hypothetical protein